MRVPVVVTGEPDTVKIPGRASPTDVTVPVPDAVTHAGTPDEFSLSSCVPLEFPGKLVHPEGPR